MTITSSSAEFYTRRAREVQKALDHMKLPDLERRFDTALLLAIGADEDEGLEAPAVMVEVLTSMRDALIALSLEAPSEQTPRDRHASLLRAAETAALEGKLQQSHELADLARLWAQAVIEFPEVKASGQ